MAGYFEDARRGAFIVVVTQMLVTVLAMGVATLAGGWPAGYAALLGGLIGTLANLAMVLRTFSGRPQRDPRRFLVRMLLGEALKFAVTVALFIIAIVVLKAEFLPLALAYIATFAAYWVELLRGGFGQTT